MFGIQVEDPSSTSDDKKKIHVWQNSWGLSTRAIGVCVMIHSDNRGLVLPPRVADTQVVIIPVGLTAKTTEDDARKLLAEVEAMSAVLEAAGVRVSADLREGYSPGWKFNDHELRGK